MASEFTRKSILNECLYNGLYAPGAEPPPQIFSPSASFLTSKTRMADQQNALNYERIMQRIRAGERRLPSSRQQQQTQVSPGVGVGFQSSGLQSDSLQLQVTDPTRRAHSLSPNPSVYKQLGVNGGAGYGSGTSTPNLAQNGYHPSVAAAAAPQPAYSSLHSRHQEFLRRRRQDNALLNLELEPTTTGQSSMQYQYQESQPQYQQSLAPAPMQFQLQGQVPQAVVADGVNGFAVDMNPAVAPFAYTGAVVRPTYSVRSVPVSSIDEVREMIGMRRQYYRDRFLRPQDGEGEVEGELGQNQDNQEQEVPVDENVEGGGEGKGQEREMVSEMVTAAEDTAIP